ncbi:ATP-binding protein [Streptomyces sp. NPDC003032]
MSPVPAVAAVGAKPLPQSAYSFEHTITPDPARVAEIRCAVADRMRKWVVPASLVEDVVLIVSELVTNAVVHGRGNVHVSMLQLYAGLHIEVADESTTPAVMGCGDAEAIGGRGLRLVAGSCDCWGVSDDGTITWCLLRAAGRR